MRIWAYVIRWAATTLSTITLKLTKVAAIYRQLYHRQSRPPTPGDDRVPSSPQHVRRAEDPLPAAGTPIRPLHPRRQRILHQPVAPVASKEARPVLAVVARACPPEGDLLLPLPRLLAALLYVVSATRPTVIRGQLNYPKMLLPLRWSI